LQKERFLHGFDETELIARKEREHPAITSSETEFSKDGRNKQQGEMGGSFVLTHCSKAIQNNNGEVYMQRINLHQDPCGKHISDKILILSGLLSS
jgi:hypothetical protein